MSKLRKFRDNAIFLFSRYCCILLQMKNYASFDLLSEMLYFILKYVYYTRTPHKTPFHAYEYRTTARQISQTFIRIMPKGNERFLRTHTLTDKANSLSHSSLALSFVKQFHCAVHRTKANELKKMKCGKKEKKNAAYTTQATDDAFKSMYIKGNQISEGTKICFLSMGLFSIESISK